jgi:hypothetical protein
VVAIITLPPLLAQNPQPVRGSVSLGGRRFLYRLHWSPAAGWGAGAWLIDIADASGVAIALAVPFVVTSDLWRLYKDDPRAPQGALAVARISGDALDPRSDDIASAFRVTYTSA